MGRLIPAGTGFEWYRHVRIPPDEPPPPPPVLQPSDDELDLEREMEYLVEPEEALGPAQGHHRVAGGDCPRPRSIRGLSPSGRREQRYVGPSFSSAERDNDRRGGDREVAAPLYFWEDRARDFARLARTSPSGSDGPDYARHSADGGPAPADS